MLAVSSLILFVCLIIWPAHGLLTKEQEESCRQQTSYSLKNLQSVKVTLYYDVDKEILDFKFVTTMCKARKTMSKATFEFYPGVSTMLNGEGKLECYHKDKKNRDCTDSLAAACASKIVADYSTLVCCTADGGSISDCFKAQNPEKIDEFNQCTKLQHPTIKPDQILLENARKGRAAYPSFDCFPIMTFNDKLDDCARFISMDESIVKVLCTMLAKNADKACNGQN